MNGTITVYNNAIGLHAQRSRLFFCGMFATAELGVASREAMAELLRGARRQEFGAVGAVEAMRVIGARAFNKEMPVVCSLGVYVARRPPSIHGSMFLVPLLLYPDLRSRSMRQQYSSSMLSYAWECLLGKCTRSTC